MTVVLLVGCARTSGEHRDDAAARAAETDATQATTAAASATGTASSAQSEALARLELAEDRRSLASIGEQDIAHRDVAVRRRAARALARIGGAASEALLTKALSDEDAEVVAWASYGLGYVCRTDGARNGDGVRALVARAASISPQRGAALDPEAAIARALGRCASDEAEKTLVAWLAGPRPRAGLAALALGDVASKRKTLGDATQIALLNAAAGGAASEPLPEALFAFARFDHPLASSIDRLVEVAVARLAEAGPARAFAVRALGRGTPAAASDLARVLTNAEKFTPAERADAARSLGRLGDAGQRALGMALPSLVPQRDPIALTTLATSAFGPLWVALDTLAKVDAQPTKKALYDLSGLALPSGAPPTLVRRIVRLRCRAAALLVNGGADDPLLTRCDPEEHGEIGERAILAVLGRRSVQGRRLAIYRSLASSAHLRVREAAVELLGAHPEIADAAAIVGSALAAKEPGVVATAAEFVAAHPDRVTGSSDLTSRLDAALARTWAPDDLETLGTVVEAAGAIRLDGSGSRIEAFCKHPSPSLREHAARALSLLKSAKISCSAGEYPAGAKELDHLLVRPATISLETDGGPLKLTLDPTDAPVATTRIVELARDGFFEGITFHRVVPGYVVQFGDPGGDGYGGPGREPLRCETTPAPFDALGVGVALSGRDTGSSQIFVTLGRQPHLDGEYAIIGKAEGDWDAVAEGDVIRRVVVQ